MIVALLMVSISYYVAGDDKPSPIFTVTGLGLYLAFFSFGIGPIAWLIPSEVFATCIRAKAMSLASGLNRVVGTIVSSSFLTVQDTVTWAGFFLLLAVACTVVLVFFYFLLPETKGHSLEDSEWSCIFSDCVLTLSWSYFSHQFFLLPIEVSLFFAEITGDFSILDAERKIRVEHELEEVGARRGTSAEAPVVEGGTLT